MVQLMWDFNMMTRRNHDIYLHVSSTVYLRFLVSQNTAAVTPAVSTRATVVFISDALLGLSSSWLPIYCCLLHINAFLSALN